MTAKLKDYFDSIKILSKSKAPHAEMNKHRFLN